MKVSIRRSFHNPQYDFRGLSGLTNRRGRAPINMPEITQAMNDYEQLRAQAEALAQEVERVRQQERDIALNDVRAKIEQYSLCVTEIYDPGQLHALRHRLNPRKIEPKYRDPLTGATWTGRGLEPRWIRGRNRQEFLIGLSQHFAAASGK
ncbi:MULTISPECIES: H-NS family nucleoid-associated regulatory protein [unclassified Burkholderia]|uniref:H-NS histone family protein n=1 Tax=unclassified Burkholderia TaxID=2613784 RepID=UPI000A7DDC02|nr:MULTISPECIES: H-NS histone family protein [unclassified Burkholderia]